MDIIETKIKDVKILKPKVFGDSRGYFMETWREEFFRKNPGEKNFSERIFLTSRWYRTTNQVQPSVFSEDCTIRQAILRENWLEFYQEKYLM